MQSLDSLLHLPGDSFLNGQIICLSFPATRVWDHLKKAQIRCLNRWKLFFENFPYLYFQFESKCWLLCVPGESLMSVGESPLLPLPPGHFSTLWWEKKWELCPEYHIAVEEQLFLPGKCALPNITGLIQSKPKTLILILMAMWPVWKRA